MANTPKADGRRTVPEIKGGAADKNEVTRLRAELARRDAENRALIARQSASIEVLRAISASPDDPQPVFELIAQRVKELYGAYAVSVTEYDGSLIHVRAMIGHEPEAAARLLTAFPRPPGPDSGPGRVILSGKPDFVRDAPPPGTIPAGRDLMKSSGSYFGVPLLHQSRVAGVLGLWREDFGEFNEALVEVAKSFAEQAVIAIAGAETLRALRTRTADLQESLEQQTATAEVLQVINASPGNLTPVFDAILEKAHQLCGADTGAMALHNGEHLITVTTHGLPDHFAEELKQPSGVGTGSRFLDGTRYLHIPDIRAIDWPSDEWVMRGLIAYTNAHSRIVVPLRKDGALLGIISANRSEVRSFSGQDIALLENFAAQAVIAIENARLLNEQREALEQQTATADVLRVINASPGNLTSVFDAILEKAHRICGAAVGALMTWHGTCFRAVATHGYSDKYEALVRRPFRYNRLHKLLLSDQRVIHIPDMKVVEAKPDEGIGRAFSEMTDFRTTLIVPLRKDDDLLGFITVSRYEVDPFSDKQISLLENFAAQAVIAMENARLINEQREALDQQTATAEVLGVINASSGNLTPVFDAMIEKSIRLCEAAFGTLLTYDGERFHNGAMRGVPALYAEFRAHNPLKVWPGSPIARLLATKRPVHALDMKSDENYLIGDDSYRALADLGRARTVLFVPLLKDATVLGFISVYRQEVRAFSGKQIALLENFAAQAVIAMESARLLNELRSRTDELAQRQAELRVTFENMGDGVAMFDGTPRLVAWNRKFQEILNLPDGILDERPAFPDYIRYLAERDEFGAGADPDAEVRRVTERIGEHYLLERTRPDGRVIEIRQNPVAGGGFVLIYADITERKRNEAEIAAARDAAQEATRTIEAAFRDLKTAQANLVQAEKMASLGQLTAGIAHEIKNPLNFVNNFASLSVDLLAELKEAAAPGFATLTGDQRAEIDEVSALLTSNLQKITEHGKRADGIVKAMLEHSRGASGERRMVDLNALVDEALNLAYHGARAQDQSFNITLERDFASGIAPIEVNPQDITRVFLNLFSNGFYAAGKRARDGAKPGFQPTIAVATRDLGDRVEIHVRDNGTGIPDDIRDKLFEPFFTTKPTGEGTGLGLSITYDIVTKQHGGTIAVDSAIDDHTEFTVGLPRQMFAHEGAEP